MISKTEMLCRLQFGTVSFYLVAAVLIHLSKPLVLDLMMEVVEEEKSKRTF